MSSDAAPAPGALVRTEDGSLTFAHRVHGELYHCRGGALAKARLIFLENSGAGERARRGAPTRILEVGLGLGLNFLATADFFAATRTPLHYTALDEEWPPPAMLEQTQYQTPLLKRGLHEALLNFRRSLPEQVPAGDYGHEISRGVALTIRIGDAASTLPPGPFDVVYHDPFSPAHNPQLWTAAFLARVTAVLAPGGVLVSYSVNAEIRRRLVSLGLDVQKLPGIRGKREVLRATRIDATTGANPAPKLRL